ncbi:hypothetical protein ACFYWY_29340 [Streptomyces sp. NPDC002870]|uniref:hypothetical protein n=1 Tax=Streptomyces sp. NPDC002870 TaxID=3364666 RepID=UPI0036A4A8B6
MRRFSASTLSRRSGAPRFNAASTGNDSLHHEQKWRVHKLLVRVSRLTGAVALSAALVLPHHHSERAAADQVPAIDNVDYPMPVTDTPRQEIPVSPVPAQGAAYGPVVAPALGGYVMGLLTLAGFRRARRWRMDDLANRDLEQTINMLNEVGVEARRLARLNGTANTENLAKLDGLVPHVEQAIAQCAGNLRDKLSRVHGLMTECVAHPAEPPGTDAAAGLGSFAKVYRQASTADELMKAVTRATTVARQLRV